MTKISVVSMVKAPLPELEMFVHYHLNIGIDEIILFFDDPTDPGLVAFPKFPQVTTIACSSDYWANITGERSDIFSTRQLTSINEGVKIAMEKGCNWVIPIDSDELINPSADIKSSLESCDADVLRFNVMEAVSEKEDYDIIFAASLFKIEANAAKIRLAKLLGCSQALFRNEYFRGHTASKMAVRISQKIQIHGNHGPRKYDKHKTTFKSTNEISLLHFDCIGFNSWNTKWSKRNDGSWRHVNMRENRKKQLKAHKLARQTGNNELLSLYKRLQTIPMREKVVLTLLGMLRRVKLDKTLFENPYL